MLLWWRYHKICCRTTLQCQNYEVLACEGIRYRDGIQHAVAVCRRDCSQGWHRAESDHQRQRRPAVWRNRVVHGSHRIKNRRKPTPLSLHHDAYESLMAASSIAAATTRLWANLRLVTSTQVNGKVSNLILRINSWVDPSVGVKDLWLEDKDKDLRAEA